MSGGGDNHTMQLRPRRSVLGDISNRASVGGNDNASNKSIKTNKRMVTIYLTFHLLLMIPICLQRGHSHFEKN
jgi:hypothetical protein